MPLDRIAADEIAASEAEKTALREADRKFRTQHFRAINQLRDPRRTPYLSPNYEKMVGEADKAITRNRFVATVEDAWYQNRGSIPLQFFADLPESDLQFFADPDFQEQVAQPLVQQGLAFKFAQEEFRAEEELAEYIYERNLQADNAQEDLLKTALRILAPLPSLIALGDPAVEGEEPEPGDLLEGKGYSQEALDLARAVRSGEVTLDQEGIREVIQQVEYLATGGTPEGEEVAADFMNFIGTGLKGPLDATMAVGHLPFDGKAALATFFGAEAAERMAGFQLASTTDEERRLLAERRSDDRLRAELHRNIKAGMLPSSAWAQLEADNPSEIETRIEMYGSYELARAGFFIEFQDVMEMLAETPDGPDQQIEDLIDSQFESMEMALDAVDEENFRGEHVIMKLLTGWSNAVDSIGATVLEATTGAVTDEDRRALAQEGRIADFFDEVAVEVERGGHTPAGVLGLEGTFSGLMLNFGMGMIFDPTNWFIGPAARGGIGLANRAATSMAMKTPAMRLWLRGLAKDLAERGPRASSLLNNLAEVGAAGEVLQAVGLADPVLGDNLWLLSKGGQVAKMTNVEQVYKLLDDVQLRQIDNLDPKKIEQAENTLRNANSWTDNIPLQYDEATGRVSVMLEGDELAVLKAAENLGVTKAPIYLRRAAGAGLTQAERSSLGVALKRWQGDSKPTQAAIRNYMEGKPLDPSVHADVEVVLRHLDPELNPAAAKHPILYRGDVPDTPPVVGETVDIPLRAFSSRQEVAAQFGHEVVDGVDKHVLYVIEDGPALQNVYGGQFEQEYLTSGSYLVTEIDGPVVKLSYQGKLIDTPAAPARGPKGPTLSELEVSPPKRVEWLDVEGDTLASPGQIFDDEFLGIEADMPRLANAVEDALNMGGVLPGAAQSWPAIALGQFVRRLAHTPPGRAIEPYLRTIHNVNSLPGQGGLRRGLELVEFLKRDDAWGRGWQLRILENEKALGAARTQTSQATARLTKLHELDQRLARRQMHDPPEAVARHVLVEEAADLGIDDVIITKMKTLDEIRFQLHQEIRKERDSLVQASMEATGAKAWNDLYMEMLEDYNRNFIATNPEWADDVGPDGLVPWSRIHRGYDPEELGFTAPSPGRGKQDQMARTVRDRFEQMELKGEMLAVRDPEKVLRMFAGNEGVVGDIRLPATPIELAAASEIGGARYTQWTQDAWMASLRYTGHFMDQLWKANVLISPRTFTVMSVDELTSLMHAGGIDFVGRYLQARADKLWARINGSVYSYKSGTKRVSETTRSRLQALDSIPDEVRSYENALAEGASREQIWMEPGALGYEQAAKQHGRNLVENPAMRAYFGGEDAFRDWFNSPEGQEWSLSQVITYEVEGEVMHRSIRNWREAYQYAHGAWQVIENIAKKEGLKGKDITRFREAFESTARQVVVERTGQGINLPAWVERYFGPLRGYQPIYPGGSMLWPTVGRAFQIGAANPAAFRQGLAAEYMRVQETARLRSLFESQGKTIVPDAELLDILKSQGLDTAKVNQFNNTTIDTYLARRGIITEGYIARLAEHRARDYVSQMTYSFEQGSRFGRQGAALFPFGRAWGDMYGRWGRLLGSRATVRPWVNRLGLGKLFQKMLDLSPVGNPRTWGFISRVAGRGMEITGGLAGESETDLDLSPMTFLPNVTGGISTLVPGLGLVPVAALDFFVDHLGPKPEEDPIGYQQMIDTLSTLVPGMQLHGRGIVSRFVGGGFIGMTLSAAVEGVRASLHRPNRGVSQFTGNIRAELVTNRSVRAALSDPDVLNDILSAESPDDVAALFVANLSYADVEAAKLNATSAALGWVIPVRGALDTNLDEVYGVWVNAARQSGAFPDVNLPSDDVLKNDPELLLRTGDDIRRRFFAMPPWQRDMLVAANPTLAVNLVSTWEWSEAAPTHLPGRDAAYSTTGSGPDRSLQEALARHENYVRHGWVVPRDPNTLPHEIVGTALDARRNVSRRIYEELAGETNNFLWENVVSEEVKARMTFALERVPGLERSGITDERSLWEKWGSQREVVLENLLESFGVETVNPDYVRAVEVILDTLPTEEAFLILQQDLVSNEEGLGIPELTPEQKDIYETFLEAVRVPEGEEAWSTEWRGDDLEAFSSRMRDLPVLVNEQAQTMIDGLNLDIDEGMTGEEALSELINYRSLTRNAAWDESRLHYTNYITSRGAGFTAGMDTLTELATNAQLDESFQESVTEFMAWIDSQVDANEGNYSRTLQNEAVDRFNRLRTAGRDAPVNWDRIWDRAFKSRFGPMDWEPPQPPALTLEDGSLNANAWSPFIQKVVDGDTIVVSENRGPSLFNVNLLPEVDIGPEKGPTRGHSVRLLGVYAEDYYSNPDAADEQTQRLETALEDARRRGDRIWLVRDPDYAGSHTDPFGRELAWLFIGDEPFYFPDELRRGQ